jgi:hypothetical protein
MKIWIVSSDQFISEFTNMSNEWVKSEHNVTLTTISRYWLDPISMLIFFYDYINIKPDSILSDHGYPGFMLVNLYIKLFKKPTKTTLFLRGNFWLEEKTRSAKN